MSYVEDIQMTPTQARLAREHVERRRRLNGTGRDSPIDLTRTFRGITGAKAELLRTQKQKQPERPKETDEQRLERIRETLIVTYSKFPNANVDEKGEPLPWRQSVTIRQIQELFCAMYGVDRLDIISARRTLGITEPRHLCVMLCKILTIESLPKIGRLFGGRDHTTMLHSCRKMKPVEDAVRARLPYDATLLQWVTETISVYREMPKYMLKGRRVRSHD